MGQSLKFLVLVLATTVLMGCGLSPEQIGQTAKMSMQETFDKDPQFSNWGLQVTNVHVLRQGDNRYQGIATVIHKGQFHDIPVEITADGSNIIWQVAPGSFMFVAQKELQNMFQYQN